MEQECWVLLGWERKLSSYCVMASLIHPVMAHEHEESISGYKHDDGSLFGSQLGQDCRCTE